MVSNRHTFWLPVTSLNILMPFLSFVSKQKKHKNRYAILKQAWLSTHKNTAFPDFPWRHVLATAIQSYRGNFSTTVSGEPCLPWSQSNEPHELFPDATREDAMNYCRNPGSEENWLWCYTSNDWDYCPKQELLCNMGKWLILQINTHNFIPTYLHTYIRFSWVYIVVPRKGWK